MVYDEIKQNRFFDIRIYSIIQYIIKAVMTATTEPKKY